MPIGSSLFLKLAAIYALYFSCDGSVAHFISV